MPNKIPQKRRFKFPSFGQSMISRNYKSDLLYIWVVCRSFFGAAVALKLAQDRIRSNKIKVSSESRTSAFDLHDDGVMQQLIQQSDGHHRVAEHLGPFREPSIRGQDHGAFFVSGADQPKEQIGAIFTRSQLVDRQPGTDTSKLPRTSSVSSVI